MINFYSY